MKYTASIIASIAAALFIQPCPAPLIATPIAALATGVVAGGGIAIGGAAAANAGGGGGAAAAKRDLAKTFAGGSNTTSDLIQKCTADMFNTPSVTAEVVYGSMNVYNCPKSCMDAVDQYNADPNIEELNALYGTISWQGSTITTSNVPGYMFQANPQGLIQQIASESGSTSPSFSGQHGPRFGGRPGRRPARMFA